MLRCGSCAKKQREREPGEREREQRGRENGGEVGLAGELGSWIERGGAGWLVAEIEEEGIRWLVRVDRSGGIPRGTRRVAAEVGQTSWILGLD